MAIPQRFATVGLGGLLFLAAAVPGFAQPGSSPHPNGGRALAALVVEGNGVLPLSIRKTVADQDNILAVDWPQSATGGHATTLYSFGAIDVKPERFLSLIRFKPDMVLMTRFDEDDSIPRAAMGATYPMAFGDEGFTLVVSDITPDYFTLVDQSGEHAGSVTFGAFKDDTGELWLFQERVGEFFTSPHYFGLHNEGMVEPTRKVIELAMKVYLADDAAQADSGSSSAGGSDDSSAPCPEKFRSSYAFDVNKHVDTDVAVQRGDVLTIKASGTVTLGIFAGDSGPEGINFNPAYSFFPDSPHGCLIGRVRTSGEDDADKWAYIGVGDTWQIKDDGLIQLSVNDNDPDNNVGAYRVEISVCRNH